MVEKWEVVKKEQTLGYIEEEVGGRREGRLEETQSYRTWTDSKQTNFLKEQSHTCLLMQISTLTDIRILLPLKLCRFAKEQTCRETRGRHEGKKLNEGQRGRWRRGRVRNIIRSRLVSLEGMEGMGEGAALCQSIRRDWEQQREVLGEFYTSDYEREGILDTTQD